VDPQRRGQGAGRALVAGCLRLAQLAGAPIVGLHTSPIMAAALRMYESAGFVRDLDIAPIRGVAYGRYMLAAPAFQAAHDILLARFPM
jgi:ribosomal protein S18 acetylase RimI-like enzyme